MLLVGDWAVRGRGCREAASSYDSEPNLLARYRFPLDSLHKIVLTDGSETRRVRFRTRVRQSRGSIGPLSQPRKQSVRSSCGKKTLRH
jgi:hypothetical protein